MKYITPIIFSLTDVLIIKYESEQRKEIENFGWIDLYLCNWQLYAHGYFNYMGHLISFFWPVVYKALTNMIEIKPLCWLDHWY